MSTQPLKKFYTQAEAGTAPGEGDAAHVVRLDGRILKTPLKQTLAVPTAALAQAIAAEWQAQGEHVIPDSMPLTQLANTMIDKAAGDERPALNDEICKYTGSDLVCYLATSPPELVRRQEDLWLPLLEWLESTYGARLTAIRGIRYEEQPVDSLSCLEHLIHQLSPADFTVVQAMTGVTGSPVIGLALLGGYVDAAKAHAAACVDEIYQLEKWGEDKLARERISRIKREIAACATFVHLTR